MNDETWLRDLLRQATAAQPRPADRARGVFAHVARRRRQRAAAASCVAIAAVFVAATLNTGPGTTSLRPVSPTGTPGTDATPSADPTAAPGTAGPGATPTGTAPEQRPSASPTTESPGWPPVDEVHYPPYGGRLDVFVLLDNTGDMVNESLVSYADITRKIDSRLKSDGVDVTWGAALFRDTQPIDVASGDTYKRIQQQQRSLPDLDDAPPAAGGGDPGEADTLALEAAVGIGHVPYTAAGQDAGFLPEATKVILLITDSFMNQGSDDPTKADTIAELRARGVLVVGLQRLESGPDGVGPKAYRDLVEVANGTGATVAHGADCDGDGRADVAAGGAFVCQFTAGDEAFDGVADALAGLARR